MKSRKKSAIKKSALSDELPTTNRNIRQCPYCYENISERAIVCPHCGQTLGYYFHAPQSQPLGWGRVEWALEAIVYWTKRWAIFDVLDVISRFTVIVAVVFWLAESGQRREGRILGAWQIISIASQMNGSEATVQAIEALNCSGFTIFCKSVPLVGLELKGLYLSGINLNGADLSSTDLSNTTMSNAELRDTHLHGTILNGAWLEGADLRRAYLWETDLIETHLRFAILSDAWIEEVDFSNADLRGADLSNTVLIRNNLRDAKYDVATRWPEDFDPKAAGAIEVESD